MNIVTTKYSSFVQNNGGRVLLLFLLFLLAIYEFVTAGFNAFSIICIIPLLALFVIAAFKYRMLVFWILIVVNFMLQMKDIHFPGPMSLYNELLEIILLVLAIIDVKNLHIERVGNIMLYVLMIWVGFCTLEVLNNTCGLGINIAAWYMGARMIAYQILYAFFVYILYITDPRKLVKYIYLWGIIALFASFWVWKQKNIGFTVVENAFIQGPGRNTHVIQGGTLIRYFSIYSDAANFGIGIASTAVAFIIFAITSKIRRHKIFFAIVGLACFWAMFPSGTRTAIFCFFAGIIVYIFLSKSLKIAVPVTIIFTLFVFILAFTNIGNSNQQIRRMRSAFDKNDASSNVRKTNQDAMRKYMKEAPWGLGLAMYTEKVPANNKFNKVRNTPADSEYVGIWLKTGIIGLLVFLITTAIMLIGACWIVLFKIKSPSLRGIGAGLCCAFVSQQLGGYGNQVLLQFPNCLVFYGGLSLVYALPFFENEWTQYEEKLLAKQEEKKRLKLEKKKAMRV